MLPPFNLWRKRGRGFPFTLNLTLDEPNEGFDKALLLERADGPPEKPKLLKRSLLRRPKMPTGHGAKGPSPSWRGHHG